MSESPTLLSDEQVRRFIADGFIVLDSCLPDALHAGIARELHFSLKEESKWLGDNLLPRVPNIDMVLQSGVAQGAMQSLLGPDFAWAPHRFPHNSEPLEPEARPSDFDPFENQPAMGEGSISGSGWHQDGHSKAGRSRWHTFKAINMFYFPHEVPLEMGPTRLLAGSHLYATLQGAVPSQVFLKPIKAGTLIVADFDLGHAGTPNRTTTSRYMLKFVALRTSNPTQPTWDHQNEYWETPVNLLTATHIPRSWESLWHWLRGDARLVHHEPLSASEIPRLLTQMASADNEERLSAMYELVRIGEPSIEPLLQKLRTTMGQDRHESPAQDDPGFYAMSPDLTQRRFSRRQFVPEDTAVALGLIGSASMDSLVALLDDRDPWMRINAAYALGEIGNSITEEVADHVGTLLDDELHQIVRAASDALCWLPYSEKTIDRITRLLTSTRDDWQESAMGEPKLGGNWSIENQVRYALSWTLLSRLKHPFGRDVSAQLEDTMLIALPIESGYTPAVLCQGLERIGTPRALRAAIQYLQPRRWDAFSFAPPIERAAA
ncbi:MAG: HEAT repeat domain-containing protein [Gammaproteobacteria bacterium]|nr:HEAT repeat domain-containing protein [Gammaproteobacteria bacterium]